MIDPTFRNLAEEAASGLRGDQELFLEVSRELAKRLEAQRSSFLAQGHNADDSLAFAVKAVNSPDFGSAKLIAANTTRLRRRMAARWLIFLLLIPVIILAIVLGYNRNVFIAQWLRLSDIDIGSTTLSLKPTPGFPSFGSETLSARMPVLKALPRRNAGDTHRFWEAHRTDADGPAYYAFYLSRAENYSTEQHYLDALHQGEQIEPENALYPLMQACIYLNAGMYARTEKSRSSESPLTDDLLNEQDFAKGLSALRAAMAKPYLRTYDARVKQIAYSSIPPPLLTDDYLIQYLAFANDFSTQINLERSLARKIGGCARILRQQGRSVEAETVMDLAKPYARMLLNTGNQSLEHTIAIQSIARLLAKDGVDLYASIGATEKARAMQLLNDQLQAIQREEVEKSPRKARADALVGQRGSLLAAMTCPVALVEPTDAELKPGRMHEHVMLEELTINLTMALLTLALFGGLLYGILVLLWHRRRDTRPLLLLPGFLSLLPMLGWGVLAPFVVYWLYSRSPIGGRDFNFHLERFPRYAIEWGVLALILLIVPALIARLHIRRRCSELGIETPSCWRDVGITWGIRLLVVSALYTGIRSLLSSSVTSELSAIGISASGSLLFIALLNSIILRRRHIRYYGTMALSLVPCYAATLLFLVLIIQPWLVGNEIYWLRKDTAVLNHPSRARQEFVQTSFEEQAVSRYMSRLKEVIR